MFFKTLKYILLALLFLSIKGYCPGSFLCNGMNGNAYYTANNILLIKSPNTQQKNKEKTKKKHGLLERRSPRLFPNANFDKPVILIYILIVVIIYSVSSIIIMLIFMIINRGRRDKTDQLINELKAQYQTALVEFLEHNKDNTKLMSQIKKIANSTFTRKILIDQMIDLSINLQKDKAEELRTLYFKLGLNEDSLEKLNNKHWHTRIKGFKECAFMNIELSVPIIEKSLNSKNDIERSEAQLALVRLNTEDPYSFLDNLRRPFSVWEQNIIHQEITYHNLKIPEFERWCYSENESVRAFSSKMIQLFNQKKSWEKLVDLIEDENEKIRASAIISLGDLKVRQSQSSLRERYQKENDDNKLLIINALSKFKNINNIVFFKHILEEEENNVWLQVEAAKGIREIGDEGKNELNNLLNSEEYRNYQIVLKQVLDERF